MENVQYRRESYLCSDSDFSWLTHRELTRFLKESARYARGRLLDAGCGNKPYYDLFKPHATTYVGVDIVQSHKFKADIIASSMDLPFRNICFDTALSTQVLEHIPEPNKMLNELSRVLKHNGIFILTAVQYWRHNEAPRDYFRFTRYGLEYLLEKNSFKILEIKTIGGAWALIGQSLLAHFAASANASYGIFRPYKHIVKKLINRFCSWLNRRFPDEEDPIGYVVVARKV